MYYQPSYFLNIDLHPATPSADPPKHHSPHPHHKSPDIAKQKVENLLSFRLAPHEIIDNDLWREAGKLKAIHNIPLADAFAAATANHLKATLVAGKDADFEGLELDLMRV